MCFESTESDPEAKKVNEEINRQIKKEAIERRDVFRILLLGPGESGKSTFLKQMKIIHNTWTDDERKYHKRSIIRNILGTVVSIAEGAAMIEMTLSKESQAFASTLMQKSEDEFFVAEFETNLKSYVDDLKKFFNDPMTQAVVAQSSKFQLPDSCAYFFNELDRIAQEDYFPSYDDLLRLRVKTTGIQEHSFQLSDENVKLQVVDVGGQRCERKKWLPLFDQVVNAVIFFAAISEYDQFLGENITVPRMEETLTLFSEIVNKPQFAKTPIVLLLNKWDLFEQKLKTIPLKSGYFKDYQGSDDPTEAYNYVKSQFTSRYPKASDTLYIYQTTAIDTTGMQKVFKSIKSALLQRALQVGGMMQQTIIIQEPKPLAGNNNSMMASNASQSSSLLSPTKAQERRGSSATKPDTRPRSGSNRVT